MFVVSAIIVIGAITAYLAGRFGRHVVYLVPEGERHVVQRWGRFRGVRRPGLRLRIPGVERISRIPDRPFAAPFTATAVTSDGVLVGVDGCLELHIEDPFRYVWSFHIVRSVGAGLTSTVVSEMIRRRTYIQVVERDRLAGEAGLALDLELDRFGLGVSRVLVTGTRTLEPPAVPVAV